MKYRNFRISWFQIQNGCLQSAKRILFCSFFFSNLICWGGLFTGELDKLTMHVKMPVFGCNVIVVFEKYCKVWMG
jgi:hypothetical protein